MTSELDASLAVFEELFDDLTRLVQGLDDACVNWVPPAPETNSIAVMVTHIVGSVDSWLARAVGETIERDRDAEFAARDSATRLVARVEEGRGRLRRRYRLLAGCDLSATLAARRVRSPEAETVTGAWCVEHALAHAGEHWGQIQLTRQLYDAQRR